MNTKAVNMEICKQIIQNHLVRIQHISNKLALVIPDPGYYGYLIKKSDIAFSLEKTTTVDKKKPIIDMSILNPKNELKITQYLRIIDSKNNARLFKSPETEVWVNTKFLKNLDIYRCRFYQDRTKPTGLILAVEDATEPVMCILPLRPFDDGHPYAFDENAKPLVQTK